MSQQGLAEGQPCPACSLEGALSPQLTSDADLIDGRTVVVHGVPTLVCNRCGLELFDEATTRTLETVYQRASEGRAHTLVVDFQDLGSRATV